MLGEKKYVWETSWGIFFTTRLTFTAIYYFRLAINWLRSLLRGYFLWDGTYFVEAFFFGRHGKWIYCFQLKRETIKCYLILVLIFRTAVEIWPSRGSVGAHNREAPGTKVIKVFEFYSLCFLSFTYERKLKLAFNQKPPSLFVSTVEYNSDFKKLWVIVNNFFKSLLEQMKNKQGGQRIRPC